MAHKHNLEYEGAKPRDHEHPRHHFWKQPHKSPLVWITVLIMLALIFVYVFTDSLSLRPGRRTAVQPTPAAP
jgi:hypothetical protein